MRKIFILTTILLSIIISSCSQLPKPAEKTRNTKQRSTSAKPTEITSEMFKQKIMDYEVNPKEWKYKGDKPAVIDFYATWCGPCKMTAPILDSLAIEYAGRINFYKVDVDKQQELASAFGIQSIPTILFIPKNGKPRMSVGAMLRPQLEKAIKDILSKDIDSLDNKKN
ncbi:MAG: thioredoxin [Prevotella sp.]